MAFTDELCFVISSDNWMECSLEVQVSRGNLVLLPDESFIEGERYCIVMGIVSIDFTHGVVVVLLSNWLMV